VLVDGVDGSYPMTMMMMMTSNVSLCSLLYYECSDVNIFFMDMHCLRNLLLVWRVGWVSHCALQCGALYSASALARVTDAAEVDN
jgi:hypothetical protein